MPWLCAIPVLFLSGGHGAALAPRKIQQISFERTRCFGTCPAYKVTINADGTVFYRGIAHVRRIGLYKGNVGTEEFKRLSSTFEKLGFFGMKPSYEIEVTDLPTYILTVVTDKGTKKVSDYGLSGPDGLWALQRLVDAVTLPVQMGETGEKLSDDPEGTIDVRVRRSGRSGRP